MAIEKNSFKVSRLDSEFSPRKRGGMSTEDRQILKDGIRDESDNDEVFDDYDSGAGSDDFDVLELGEVGEEFCQIGDQTCSVPFELYDLSGLGDILSMEAWNECLTEEERFGLTKYLPDMDQEMFLRTVKQLFTGCNLHFGSPIVKLFDMMKGGLCEPKVVSYRQGLMYFQKRQHCHFMRKYHNTMVVNLHQIRDAWLGCNGCSIEEKLQVLNMVKSQKSLRNENMEEFGAYASLDKAMPLREEKLGKTNFKNSSAIEVSRSFPSSRNGLETTVRPDSYLGGTARENMFSGYGVEATVPMMGRMQEENDEETAYETAGPLKTGKRIAGLKSDEYSTEYFRGSPGSSMKGLHAYGSKNTVDKLSDIKFLTSKPSQNKMSNSNGKKVIYPRNVQPFSVEEQIKYGTSHAQNSFSTGSRYELFNGFDPFWQNKAHREVLSADMSPVYGDRNLQSGKRKVGSGSSNYNYVDRPNFSGYDAKFLRGSTQSGGHSRRYGRCEETESDSSEPVDDDDDNNPLMRSKLAYPHEDFNGSFTKKAKVSQKEKMGQLLVSPYNASEDGVFSGSARLRAADNQREVQKFGKKFPLHGPYSRVFDRPPQISQKEEFGHHLPEYILDDKEGSHRECKSVDQSGCVASYEKKVKKLEFSGADFHEVNDVPLSLPKWKVTDLNVKKSQKQLGNANLSKKRGKKHADEDLEKRNYDPSVSEMADANVDQEPRSQKKPVTPITPTVHSSFSFSVVHLLSAVRMAMVSMLPEESSKISGTNKLNSHEDLDMNKSEPSVLSKVPSLTVLEIINRVRSNPGDPCILETQEPLQDLVRGVLKIFSSKTAPLGAKGWKMLASYEKSTKSWSWTGPIPQSLSNTEASVEVTSPEAWLLPHKMLVKLVDAFAHWLKSGQETLRLIGSLPNPPLSLTQSTTDEKERFRDLRAQKSLNTISFSTEEIRDYFRKEEFLRYSIPDRAFSYTAIDGKKTIVAPLRRCGGKPTSKARDHFMLKRDRPPHVTILCLVRDAAARLPGSIGTRADVCTLIRDSQYIVEDVSDTQVNQVVSGAMDRLHYERDPCVQFDGERKLWVYLHRDREEEDFEDDGTSSTKKWKRQKKDAPEPFEQEVVTLAHHGGGEQSGIDLGSDLNAKPPSGDEHKMVESSYIKPSSGEQSEIDLGSDLIAKPSPGDELKTVESSYDGSHSMKENVDIGVGSVILEQTGFNLGSDLNAKPLLGDEHKAIGSFSYDINHMMKDNVEIGVGSELQVQSGFDLSSGFIVKPSYGDELKVMEPLYYDGNHSMEDNAEIGGAMQQSSTMAWESLGLNSTQDNELLCQENARSDDFGDETFVPKPPDEFLSSKIL